MVRAEVGAIEVRAMCLEQLCQASLDGSVVGDCVEPAPDSRLIAHDDDKKPVLVELPDRLRRSGE